MMIINFVVYLQVIDNVVMNRNTVAVNASLSVPGQQSNGVFRNDTSKRITFNSSQLIDVQQDTLAVNVSLVFESGSCSERISERFQGMYLHLCISCKPQGLARILYTV